MEISLGRIEKVIIRDVWQHEALAFTPWLAQDENIALLADTLGLGLIQVEATEKDIGRFSADIVGKDDQDNYVLIENQLESTDHRHLGQVLTYLAGLEGPATVIWIATEFLEEHRAAIDWLNAHTSNDFSFFGVVIEAVRIGNSPIAPRFDVVAKPNDFVRNSRALVKSAEDLRPRHHMRIAYWASFADYLKSRPTRFKINRQNKDHWFEFSLGRRGCVYSATITSKINRVGMELYFHNDADKHLFNTLYLQKEEIEAEFSMPLEWLALPGKKASRIAYFNVVEDIYNQEAWPALHDWMFKQLTRFDQVFTRRVKAIQMPETYSPDED